MGRCMHGRIKNLYQYYVSRLSLDDHLLGGGVFRSAYFRVCKLNPGLNEEQNEDCFRDDVAFNQTKSCRIINHKW